MSCLSSRRRPRHHMYDYNYKAGESSYQDMLAYLDRKEGRRTTSPLPARKSYAERLAERPTTYGELSSLQQHGSSSLRAVSPDLAPELPQTRRSSPPPRRPRLKIDADDDDDFLMKVRARPAVAEKSLDADTEEIIASIRRGAARAAGEATTAAADAIGATEPVEDLGTRTRRALREIDEEFAAMGLYNTGKSAGQLATSAEAESDVAVKTSSVSAKKEVSSSSRKNMSSSGASSAKRSVTYAE